MEDFDKFDKRVNDTEDFDKVDKRTLYEIYSISNKRKKTKSDARKMKAQLKKAVDQALGKKVEEVVYLIGYGDYLKIGYSTFFKKRLAALESASPQPLIAYATIPGNKELEEELHQKFRKHHIKGEWFRKEQEIIDYFAANATRDAA